MSISRGPSRRFDTPPGGERATFLREVALILETDPAALELTAPLAERYGVDDLEIYEYVQIAEDVWQVQLNSNPMTGGDFAEMATHLPSLEAIMVAAENARRRADA